MGLSHRSQRFAARTRQQQQQTPTGLPRLVNQVLELASEPLLQTGQARLGAIHFVLPPSSFRTVRSSRASRLGAKKIGPTSPVTRSLPLALEFGHLQYPL
jgi:hypothetical protein